MKADVAISLNDLAGPILAVNTANVAIGLSRSAMELDRAVGHVAVVGYNNQ